MKCIVIIFLGLFSVAATGQGLLINGGFEDENTCTEYKIECAPEAWISSGRGLDKYISDPARAHSGEYCMALEAGHSTRPFERTFIRSQLICLMKRGSRYRLELFIKSSHALLDSIGVYFGPIDPLMERKPIHLLAPSLYFNSNKSNQFRKDSSWQKVILDYTANGEEAFVSIANFSRNDVNGNTGIRRRNEFLIFIDDVSLTPLDPLESLCENWKEMKQEIYEQNERHQYLERILKLRRNPNLQRVITTAPLTAKSDTLLLPDVLFASGKKELHSRMAVVLDSFCKSMKGRQIDSLTLEGHTDNTGSVAANERLAAGRAESAADYLRQCTAFAATTLTTRGWGSRKPINANNTSANRQRNRRVQVVVFFKD